MKNPILITKKMESQVRGFINNCQSMENEESHNLLRLMDKWNTLHHQIQTEVIAINEDIYLLAQNHFEILTQLVLIKDEEII